MAALGRYKAVSAAALSLGLSGIVVLAAVPLMSADASVAGAKVAARATDIIEGNPDGDWNPEDPGPQVTETVTVTRTPGRPTANPESTPRVTVTQTITPTPKRPRRSATTAPPAQAPAAPPAVPPAAPADAVPTLPVNPPAQVSPPGQPADSASEPVLNFPEANGQASNPAPSPADAFQPPAAEEPAPESVPVELRQATPEYDQATLSRTLAIPALVLVLLALFAVLIFEGRLRRMAHAAAVRKAGPRVPGSGAQPHYQPYPAYPGQQGYAYQGGPAYAPIISFVPVQTYPAYPGEQGQGHPYAPMPGGQAGDGGQPGQRAMYDPMTGRLFDPATGQTYDITAVPPTTHLPDGSAFPAHRPGPTDGPPADGPSPSQPMPGTGSAGSMPGEAPGGDAAKSTHPAHQPDPAGGPIGQPADTSTTVIPSQAQQPGGPDTPFPAQPTPAAHLPGTDTSGATLPGHGAAAPTLPGHGAAAPTLPGHGAAAPTLPGHGAAAPTLPGHGAAAPTEGTTPPPADTSTSAASTTIYPLPGPHLEGSKRRLWGRKKR
ncbi:hypothetical protein SAMN05421505_10963 [Sinosporangium album]|uniref:Uncharacterized protein n=1 Tax=Sinosporangium album TaxID=504805 RepID=A0A1G7Y172_9ACTN|nr:hypothetical protein [Sinosporangium album]SDG90232.1 hypothetical protein SAMN05421505_10963 [Sinosporangium album]